MPHISLRGGTRGRLTPILTPHPYSLTLTLALTLTLTLTLALTLTGDVSVSSSERGLAQQRQAQPRTLPAVHEATAVCPLPAASYSRTHVPRRQARAVPSESNPIGIQRYIGFQYSVL